MSQDKRTSESLEEHFAAFIAPLLGDSPEDVAFAWEFQKFLHIKKLKEMTAKNERQRKWKRSLLAR